MFCRVHVVKNRFKVIKKGKVLKKIGMTGLKLVMQMRELQRSVIAMPELSNVETGFCFYSHLFFMNHDKCQKKCNPKSLVKKLVFTTNRYALVYQE